MVTSEATLPQFIAEDHHQILTRLVFVRNTIPTNRHSRSEQLEEGWGDTGSGDALRLTLSDQRELGKRIERRKVLERSAPRAPVDKVRRGHCA
jgi:hypothetical protein